MKKNILVALFGLSLFASTAQAHLDLGKYQGTDLSSRACEFEVKAIRFEGGVRHPLNERVEIQVVDGSTFILGHAPEIDRDHGQVLFDHHHLSGARGVKDGADAAVIWMEHSEHFEGPRVFHFIHHDYKEPRNNVHVECGDLKKAQ